MNNIPQIIRELEQQRDAITKAIDALRGVGGDVTPSSRTTTKEAPRKRQMSEEGRRRIAEAARKRWAEAGKGTAKQTTKNTAKKTSRKKAAKKAARKQTATAGATTA